MTPGEWEMLEGDWCAGFVVADDRMRILATVIQKDPHPVHGGGISRDEALSNAQAIASLPALIKALRRLPDDVDMIEHNPDEGMRFFCCGADTSLDYGRQNHAAGCWYVALRAAVEGATHE